MIILASKDKERHLKEMEEFQKSTPNVGKTPPPKVDIPAPKVDEFDQMDKNKDGHITKKEFIVGLPDVIRKAHVAKLHRQATKRLRKRGASRKGKNISAQHIEALFDILDKDENQTSGEA